MQNIIRPVFNQSPIQTQNIAQKIDYILQQKLPQEFLEGVQKISAEELLPEAKKNKLSTFLSYCDSTVLSRVLASIIAEYYKSPIAKD